MISLQVAGRFSYPFKLCTSVVNPRVIKNEENISY